MGWVAAILAEWLLPFTGIGMIWKPAAIGWVLWTMSGFVDSFFPRGTGSEQQMTAAIYVANHSAGRR